MFASAEGKLWSLVKECKPEETSNNNKYRYAIVFVMKDCGGFLLVFIFLPVFGVFSIFSGLFCFSSFFFFLPYVFLSSLSWC